MGCAEIILKRLGDLGAAALCIPSHFVQSKAIITILQLAERFHRFAEQVVDNGKAILTVFVRFPSWIGEALGIVHQIEAPLQDIRAAHQRETVEIQP